MTWTKGYLTGGEHPGTPEEWDALYRLEGARRRWRLYRGYYQQASARYFGPSAPNIVTARHVLPNPAYAVLRAQEAETNRRWAERQAELAEHEKERLAAKRARAAKWAPFGGRDRWIEQQRVMGRDPGAIAGDVELSRTRVNQILSKARIWRGPRGRVFDPDPLYPRDAWITWVPETDPNDIPDHQAA